MVPVKPFQSLGEHVQRQQVELVDPTPDHARLKAELLAQAFDPRRRRKRVPAALATVALAAALVLAYWSFARTHDLRCFAGPNQGPIAVGAWISAPSSEPLRIGFSDGTSASLWPQARARVTRLSPLGADLVVEQGRASFDVVHRSGGHWLVSTGPFVVLVTGTRFDVEWQPDKDRFELNLYEGNVRVSGCALGAGQDVHAGQRIEVSCARNEYGVSALGGNRAIVDPPTPVAGAASTPSGAPAQPVISSAGMGTPPATPPSALPSGTQHGVSASEDWAALARAGRFADAYDSALAVGFEAECGRRTAVDVLLLGQAARLSGHIERAEQAYRAVRQRWPNSADGALAAFQMGRAAFDQRRDYLGAERWLRAYLAEEPNGEFASPALGRLMEAEVHLGRYESARGLAKSYLERYPKGSHAAAADQVLGAPTANAP